MELNDFVNFFKYYKEEPQQKAGIEILYNELPQKLKDDLSEWVRVYRKKPETSDTSLDVKYFSQRDNYRDANRTCFSSSCAMMLEYLKPGTCPGDRGDDEYIKTVFNIGDTTEAWVHLNALESYGLDVKYIQNGSLDTLRSQIDKGKPVPIGILHHGPSNAPSGGGHWICVIGYDDTGFIVHDPWGEIDHASGTYISTNGERLHYSNELIGSRWTVDSTSDGWAIFA
jgi:uncharacterized protein YvpB